MSLSTSMAKAFVLVFLFFLFINPVSAGVNAVDVPANTTQNYTTKNKNMSWTIYAEDDDKGGAHLWVRIIPADLGYSCVAGSGNKANTPIYQQSKSWYGIKIVTFDVFALIHNSYPIESLITNRQYTFDQSGDSYLCFETRLFIVVAGSSYYFYTRQTMVKLIDDGVAEDNPIGGAAGEVGDVFRGILSFNEIFFTAMITITALAFLKKNSRMF